MDLCRNVTVSGAEFPPEKVLSPPCSKLGSLDDLFSVHTTEVDVSLEWLSILVEDCLSSTGNCLPQTTPNINLQKPTDIIPSKPLLESPLPQTKTKLVIPSKARSKRKRPSCPKIPKTHQTPLMSFTRRSWSNHNNTNLNPQESDPPLLQQAYWLADSELILPQKQEEVEEDQEAVMVIGGGGGGGVEEGLSPVAGSGGQQARRCSHCLSHRTPQWRAGPMGPKTLCNACGVRYKSGRLLPEYRPAKSPTFVSYKHSNSHKKVLEMRTLSSLSPTTHH